MHIASVFWMVVCVCMTMSISVYYVSGRQERDGLQVWAAALFCHGIAYLLFLFRGQISDILSILVANSFISLSYSLFLMAILKFYHRTSDPFLLFAPPVMLTVVYVFIMDNFSVRVMAGNAIFAAQCIAICFQLMIRKVGYPHRGQTLVLGSIAALAVIFLSRILTVIFSPDSLTTHFQPTVIQTATYMTVFIVMLLISNGFVLMVSERTNHQLRMVAMNDVLTGCWNRVRVIEIVDQEVERLRRYGYPVSLVMADIDNLKQINRRYGHSAGDEALCVLADTARQIFRETDVIGRLEKDSFAIVLPSTGVGEAVSLAEKLYNAYACRALSFGSAATISIGVAMCRSSDSSNQWYERAEGALKRAMASSRNKVMVEQLDDAMFACMHDLSRVTQLRWCTSYETGISQVDAQHKSLFEAMNMLFMLGGDTTNKTAFMALLSPLLADMRRHFGDEEAMLMQVNKQNAQNHSRLHQALLWRIEDLQARYLSGKVGGTELFHFLMFEYIAQHVLIEDLKIFSDIANDTSVSPLISGIYTENPHPILTTLS